MTTTTDQPVEAARKERGARMRRIRRSRGMSVPVLASGTDCSAKHIFNIECGDKRPGVELLVRICQRLNVPFDELALDEDRERFDA